MEPIYEHIQPNIGSSFYTFFEAHGCVEPLWHIHPEYELVYIHSGSAEHYIGRNAFNYTNGDLLLIGSNVPHSNLGNQNGVDNFEVIVQMGTDLIDNRIKPFPEFTEITKLFERSVHGLSFYGSVKTEVGVLLSKMVNLDPFEKLMALYQVLHKLAKTKQYRLINNENASVEVQSNDYNRLKRINEYIEKNYDRPIALTDMANLIGLTETSFSRFFKNVTGRTFVSFLNEYRIQKACALLANKNTSITKVMELSGFIEPSHFSRIFKRYTKYTPREYRKKIRSW